MSKTSGTGDRREVEEKAEEGEATLAPAPEDLDFDSRLAAALPGYAPSQLQKV